MSDFCLEIRRQIDDVNSAERAFLGTDAAADTETFGNKGDFRLWGNLNAELAGSNHRAGFLALLAAFLKVISEFRQRSKV